MPDICGCFSDTASRVSRGLPSVLSGREVEEPRTAPYLADSVAKYRRQHCKSNSRA
jgi:hypothetical protein